MYEVYRAEIFLRLLGFITLSFSGLCVLVVIEWPEIIDFKSFFFYMPIILGVLVTLIALTAYLEPEFNIINVRPVTQSHQMFAASVCVFSTYIAYILFYFMVAALLYSGIFFLKEGAVLSTFAEMEDSYSRRDLPSFLWSLISLLFKFIEAFVYWVFLYTAVFFSKIVTMLFFIIIPMFAFSLWMRYDDYYWILTSVVGFFGAIWIMMNLPASSRHSPEWPTSLDISAPPSEFHVFFVFLLCTMAIGAAALRVSILYLLAVGAALGGAFYSARELYVCFWKEQACIAPSHESIYVFLGVGAGLFTLIALGSRALLR